MTTLSQQILKLRGQGWIDIREIARKVYDTKSPTVDQIAYVRVVAQQRKGAARPCDVAWREQRRLKAKARRRG